MKKLWRTFLQKLKGPDGRDVLANAVHESTDVTALSCNAMVMRTLDRHPDWQRLSYFIPQQRCLHIGGLV